jgi:hypothetical protein
VPTGPAATRRLWTHTGDVDRRQLLRGALGAGGVALGGSLWRHALGPAAAAVVGPGPYGPLRAPDANGVRLPQGFTSRVVARTGVRVGTYTWHGAPDGGACFPTGDGGWVYASNSELVSGGGAGVLRFAPDGRVVGGRRILSGTSSNCAGGATPWGTWLSCEETERGRVWECDPTGGRAAVVRPAMGRFVHEAAAVDPPRKVVYLTEDAPDGCFYRFRPTTWPDLSRGVLDVLAGAGTGVAWLRVPDPSAASVPTRYQVAAVRRFSGGEGCWWAKGVCWFTTKGDGRVWRYDVTAGRLEVAWGGGQPLIGPDNVVGSRSQDLYVAEDGGDLQVCVLTPEGEVAPFLQVVGHDRSELTGPAFSPDGTRLYFSSQRGTTGRSTGGITFEVRGRFRSAVREVPWY